MSIFSFIPSEFPISLPIDYIYIFLDFFPLKSFVFRLILSILSICNFFLYLAHKIEICLFSFKYIANCASTIY